MCDPFFDFIFNLFKFYYYLFIYFTCVIVNGFDEVGHSIEHRHTNRETWMKENFNIKAEVIYVVPRLVPSKPKCSALSLATRVSLH